MNDINAIVLDLGHVVFDISFERMYRYWAEHNGADIGELEERLVFDEMYCRFERGELAPDEYRDYAIGKLGIDMDYDEFDRGWNSIYLEVLPGIDELVQGLSGHYRLGVLTNTNEIHAQRWRVRYASILKYFDDIFCSFELGARKPEPAIFRKMLGKLSSEPETIVFFDDKEENARGAAQCGIKAFQVRSSARIISELKEMGVGGL